MENKIYGYCRISTSKQKIERQIENIRRAYPNAIIMEEVYTGTKSDRPQWKKLLPMLNEGDTIVFDSVSRMSRNSSEGFETYMELYNDGINLVFLKEATINTDSFKSVLGNEQLSFNVSTNDIDTDNLVNGIMEQVATYITKLAEKQIKLAFHQSQKEVDDLKQRTSEGMEQAKKRGSQIGRKKGSTIVTQKSLEVKKLIVQYHKLFNGNLNDIDCIDLIKGRIGKLSRNTFYKYKSELKSEKELETKAKKNN